MRRWQAWRERWKGLRGWFLSTGAEPAAINYPREIARLREKKAAGAELVMTQPVYDPVVLGRFLDDCAPLGLPVLVGILPLASYRNAEFLHNEVPGMQVPVRAYYAVNVLRLNRFLQLPDGSLFHAHNRLFAFGWALGMLF